VGTTAAELGIVEAINVVGDADEKLQVERPVVTGLEGSEAIEYDGFDGRSGPQRFVEQQAVATEPLGIALEGRVSDPCGAGELPQARAADDAPEGGLQEVRRTEPVVDGEGL
jgi:hypothetical protein